MSVLDYFAHLFTPQHRSVGVGSDLSPKFVRDLAHLAALNLSDGLSHSLRDGHRGPAK
jgi:hypothetical protein